MAKFVSVKKVAPSKCHVCESTDVEYVISYRDPDKPGVRQESLSSGKDFYGPTDWIRACKEHVAECMAIMLRRNKLTRDGS